MKTQYLVPVCFAAAAHGALLFGFSRPVRVVKIPVLDREEVPFVVNVIREDELPVVLDSERTESTTKTAPEVEQPPRTPEPPPPVVLASDPTMVAPPITPVSTTDFNHIINPVPGVSGGKGDNPWSRDILSSDVLDNSPRTRFQASPLYPHEAKRVGMTGRVLVEFVVDEQGTVRDPRVVESSDRVFEEATLRAVSKWRFEPGRRHGQIVRFRMSAPVIFSLND